jgi:hypothetical protein
MNAGLVLVYMIRAPPHDSVFFKGVRSSREPEEGGTPAIIDRLIIMSNADHRSVNYYV